MRTVRAALRTEGGATAMGIDPVASLSYPFTAPELLVVSREALAFKLSLTAPAAALTASRSGPAAAPGSPPASSRCCPSTRWPVGQVGRQVGSAELQ